MNETMRDKIVNAIQMRQKLQLAYRRSDDSSSLHTVAPVDLQLGDTTATSETEYLWAYCYAQERAERHRCDGIVTVRVLDEAFEPKTIMRLWPSDWTLPDSWRVSRAWDRDK